LVIKCCFYVGRAKNVTYANIVKEEVEDESDDD